jgi:hypothetical protein
MPTRLLRITSKDRSVQSLSKYNFTFSTNDYDLHQARRIMLKSAIIPNTQYNINNNNRTLTWEIAGVPTSVSITAGQYTLAQFITAIEAAAIAITLTVTQDAITGKLTLATVTAVEWIDSVDGNAMANVLGIEIGAGSGADGVSFVPSGLPNLMGLRQVYISSSMLSNNTAMITEDKQKINVFADIPIDVPYGALQIVDNAADTLDYTDFHSKKNISISDIKLLDENDNVVELNGADFTLIFHVE